MAKCYRCDQPMSKDREWLCGPCFKLLRSYEGQVVRVLPGHHEGFAADLAKYGCQIDGEPMDGRVGVVARAYLDNLAPPHFAFADGMGAGAKWCELLVPATDDRQWPRRSA